MAALVTIAILGIVAAVAMRGHRDAQRANEEKLDVIRTSAGKRLRLDVERGGRMRFIVPVVGLVRPDPDNRYSVILETEGDVDQSVPLGQIRAVYRGEDCLGNW